VLEIDGASNRGIDEIRQIIENVRYQPAKCRFKIYIIDEVHQVTKDAFNALLKTLEEPPPSVKFILATTEPHRLPETILSRCQRYDFRRISLREIIARLSAIAESEGLKITAGALVLLAREADGSMRDAQSLLEQVLASAAPAGGPGEEPAVDETLLQDILGLAAHGVLYDISAAVLASDARRCLTLVAEVVHQGRDLNRLSHDLVEHFRNLLVARLTGGQTPGVSGAQLLDLPDQEIADLAAQTQSASVETLLDYFEFMAAGDEEVNRATTPRFALETLLIRLATLPQSLPVAQLIERLERLEGKAPLAAKPQTSAPRPSSISAAPRPQSAPANETSGAKLPLPNAAPRRAESATAWGDFVAFVGKEQKFLASHLDAATVLSMPPGQLKIGVSERHHLAFLQDVDNLATLKDLARRFFAQDVALQISSEASSAAPPAGEPGFAVPAGPAEERSEMVKEALRIFGGSIRNVRRDN
jgi:DNA polymerase-3 subunit gamma/tau